MISTMNKILEQKVFPLAWFYIFLHLWWFTLKFTSSKLQFCVQAGVNQLAKLLTRHENIFRNKFKLEFKLVEFSKSFEGDLLMARKVASRCTFRMRLCTHKSLDKKHFMAPKD